MHLRYQCSPSVPVPVLPVELLLGDNALSQEAHASNKICQSHFPLPLFTEKPFNFCLDFKY